MVSLRSFLSSLCRLMRRCLPLLLLPLLALGSCVCSTGGVNRGDVNLISLDREWAMGEQLAAEIVRQVELVEDPAAQAYIQRLGAQIVAETEFADRSWQFHLVEDPSVNAFAIPGGHVFVHTGLVAAAKDVHELAGVVGHEIAHGVARHGTERMTKLYGLERILSLVLGESPGLLEQIAVQVLGSGAVAKFSRDDEAEADALGLRFIAEAGYDPDGMAAMFTTMLALRERRPNLLERFFASHPLTEDRIAAVEAAAEELPAPSTPPRDDPDYAAFRARIEPAESVGAW